MNDLTIVPGQDRSVADITGQVAKIQDLMKSVMKDGEHYGVIPGTSSKPSLLKPGAEKLCLIFRLAPEFDIKVENLPNGHREYLITCRLRSMSSGEIVGSGVGSCSSMESKYRYRNNSDYEILETPIPEDSKEKKSEYRKQGFGMKKVNGEWVWVKYTSEGKVENPDIADVFNTVLKMAKKRAHIDATITACAASDIFTQDVEDDERGEEEDHGRKQKAPRAGPPPPPHAPKTRGKIFQESIWYAKLTPEEAKKAVFSVCDPFEYGNDINTVINKIDEILFKKVLEAVEKTAVNKEAANA